MPPAAFLGRPPGNENFCAVILETPFAALFLPPKPARRVRRRRVPVREVPRVDGEIFADARLEPAVEAATRDPIFVEQVAADPAHPATGAAAPAFSLPALQAVANISGAEQEKKQPSKAAPKALGACRRWRGAGPTPVFPVGAKRGRGRNQPTSGEDFLEAKWHGDIPIPDRSGSKKAAMALHAMRPWGEERRIQ